MSIEYSEAQISWTEFAAFSQSNILDVCASNPTADACATPAPITTPAPTPAPTPGPGPDPLTSSVTLTTWELLVWNAGTSVWESLDTNAPINSSRPVAIRLLFSAEVHPELGADAHLQITAGVRAPHVESIPIPAGKLVAKQFPTRELDSGSTYMFYIDPKQLLDASNKPLDRVAFIFRTADGEPVTIDPTKHTQDERKNDTPSYALIGGLAGLGGIGMFTAAYALCDRRRRRLTYRSSVAPVYTYESPQHHEPGDVFDRKPSQPTADEGKARQKRPSKEAKRPHKFAKDDFDFNTNIPGAPQYSRPTPGQGDAKRTNFQREPKRSHSFGGEGGQNFPAPLLGEGDEVARITKELADAFKKKKSDSLEARKKDFKFLLLRWHPDKNADQLQLATKIFQYIQGQKEWYLDEKETVILLE